MNKFRKIRYTDDGCTLYQCLNCREQYELRDDPARWVYCPCCGVKWEAPRQYACRDHEIPRWYYDRYGNRADYDAVIRLPDGEHRADDVMYRGCWAPPTHKWVFESRHDYGRGWSKWNYEWSTNREKLSEAKWVLSVLRRERGPDMFGVKNEYRARLVPNGV